MRAISTIPSILLALFFAASLQAQAVGKIAGQATPLNAETFAPTRWAGAHWILFFHEKDLSDSYYTYRAKNYIARYGVKFAFRGKDRQYAVVDFFDGQVYCDPHTENRSQFLDFGGDNYRVSDGMPYGGQFDPFYIRKREKVVPGSVLDIVSKAVCKAVLASGGKGLPK